jgi:NADPH-dependent 2,4-dienoyl-CoA reductase/sulfur reductase-like enzyme
VNIVVIGAGLTGANAVEELRDQGYAGDITLIGAEPHLPYERPPLSKGLLLGTAEPGSVFAHDQDWYADHHVDLRLGSPVTGLDLGRAASSSRAPRSLTTASCWPQVPPLGACRSRSRPTRASSTCAPSTTPSVSENA